MTAITITEDDETAIKNLLIGHRVEKVGDDTLRLDDGTVLRLKGNDGGCSCGAGDYDLTELNGCDNVITSVELVDHSVSDDNRGKGEEGVYRIFVFAEDKRINLATFEGDDGNGYYGTGYTIEVQS